jgi:hypothetical protein
MTVEAAYIQFLQLVNRNATNNNVNVDRFRFVLLYNDMQNRFVEWTLNKRNDDRIRDIQLLLVTEQELEPTEVKENYTSFSLPEDFFNFANVKARAKTECCETDQMLVYEVKSEDVEEILNDKYSEPSFDWRETFGFHSDNSFVVYKKDFDLEQLLFTYYRYPRQIDIVGYPRLDGTPSVSVDPEFDDKVVNTILLACAKEFSAINENPNSYQLDRDRLFNI